MEQITVQVIINEPVEKVWQAYTNPVRITKRAVVADVPARFECKQDRKS